MRRFDRRAVGEARNQPGGGSGRKRADRAAEEASCGESIAGELTHHLGYAKGEAPEEVDNPRNGYSKKTVVGEDGAMEIEVPRDRSGSFEPLLIAKGQKRFEGFDEKIIAMYARGMTVREIQGFLLDQYKVEVERGLYQHGDRFGARSRCRVAESASGAQLSGGLFRCPGREDSGRRKR